MTASCTRWLPPPSSYFLHLFPLFSAPFPSLSPLWASPFRTVLPPSSSFRCLGASPWPLGGTPWCCVQCKTSSISVSECFFLLPCKLLKYRASGRTKDCKRGPVANFRSALSQTGPRGDLLYTNTCLPEAKDRLCNVRLRSGTTRLTRVARVTYTRPQLPLATKPAQAVAGARHVRNDGGTAHAVLTSGARRRQQSRGIAAGRVPTPFS